MLDHDTMCCASELDTYIVRKLLADARAAAAGDDSRLLCATATPVLTAALEAAACGVLPRAQWRPYIAAGLDAAAALSTSALPPVHSSLGGLLHALDGLVPMELQIANLEAMQAHWIAQLPPGVEVPGAPVPPAPPSPPRKAEE